MDKKSLVTKDGKEFRLTERKVLLRMDKMEQVTKSGIILPSTAEKETDYKGVVVAVSKYYEEEPNRIPLGSVMIVQRRQGRKVPVDDTDFEYREYTGDKLRGALIFLNTEEDVR